MSEHNSKSNEPKLIAEFKIEELRGKKLNVDLAGLPGIQQQLSLQVHVPDPKDPLKSDSPVGPGWEL